MSLREAKCTSCGGVVSVSESSRIAFCPYCGAEFVMEAQPVIILSDATIVTNTSKQIEQIETMIETKDWANAKKVIKAFQAAEPKNFYAWYYDLICIRNSPVEGKLGKFVNGLNKLIPDAVAASQSAKEGNKVALRNAAIVASDTLSLESFQMVLFKTLKCISKDKQDEQLDMVFAELKILTDTMWKSFATKEYAKWTMKEKNAALYERRFSGFFMNFAKEAKQIGISEAKQYNDFMRENGANYFKLIKRILYKCFMGHYGRVGKEYRNGMKEIFAQYNEVDVDKKSVQADECEDVVRTPKNKKNRGLKLLVGIILAPVILFVGLIAILVIARLLG